MAPGHRELVADFLAYKLAQKGHSWSPAQGGPEPAGPGGAAVQRALRAAGDAFEIRYRRAFGALTPPLPQPPESAARSWELVARGLFQDRCSWGRVVAFFCFGAALCVQSAEQEAGAAAAAEAVARVAAWMAAYLEEQLEPWIRDQGGWDAFAELYGPEAAAPRGESAGGAGGARVPGRWLLAGLAVAGLAMAGLLLAGALCGRK